MAAARSATLAIAGVLLIGAWHGAGAQRGAPARPPALPRLSMTCPMHPDVIEREPGSCPLCKMALVPVRLGSAWICPVHTTVMSDDSGTCRICRRPLVEARVALTWTCSAQPGIDRLEPGTCPDGRPTVARRTLRPHGNHNPQHGGQFFMAADNWHHVEGTYPRQGVFRLYVYDDYARPISAAAMTRARARVVTNEEFDPRTRTTKEITSFPLRPSRDGTYLEARVTGTALPAAMTAKIRLKPDAPEYRFDFRFSAVTKDPAPAVAARPSAPRAPARPAAAPERSSSPRSATPASTTDTAREPAPATATPVPAVDTPTAEADLGAAVAAVTIPDTIPEILAALKVREHEVQNVIREGDFAAVWVPAFQAKDLAVALEPHIGHLAPSAREAAEPALQRLVRLAWLLDSLGDLGNRQQVEDAYAAFSRATGDVLAAFGGAQP